MHNKDFPHYAECYSKTVLHKRLCKSNVLGFLG